MKETSVTQHTSTTSLTILRDEVSMLEHELRRAKTENAVLLESLQRAEKLVYGSSLSGSAPHEAAENAPNHRWVSSTRPLNLNPYAGHHAAVMARAGPASASAAGAGASRAKKGKSVSRNTYTLTRSSPAAPATSATKRRAAAAASTPNWGANLPSR